MKRKMILTILVVFIATLSAHAATLDVYPTGTPADIYNVQAALFVAQPGDTIVLHAGVFDWSGNSNSLPPLASQAKFGLPLTVSNITITGETGPIGERLTFIAGPVDTDGYPMVYPDPAQLTNPTQRTGYANAAFFGGPGVAGVTIRDLNFSNFEVVLGLVQTRRTDFANRYVPGGDFSQGADDFLFEHNSITNSFAGIQGIGGNDRLAARDNEIGIVWRNGQDASQLGLFAFPVGLGNALGPLNSSLSDVPTGITFEHNKISGPAVPLPPIPALPAKTSGVFVIGSLSTRLESNSTTGFTAGIVIGAQGNSVVSHNTTALAASTGMVVTDTSASGIPASNTTNAIIAYNRATGNFRGIQVEGDCNLIVGNDVSGNTNAGIARNERAENNLFLENNAPVVAIINATQLNNVIEPLPNLTQSNDPGACSALVSLPSPSSSANCWSVTNDAPAGNIFPVGMTAVTWTATNAFGSSTTVQQTVTVNDTENPTISIPAVDKPELWPPNHQMVDVAVSYNATDNCGAVASALSVSSNEPVNGTGDGDTSPDWEIVDAHHVRLRAERAATGNGRDYTITIRATDGAGNSSTQNVRVQVPKSRSN